MFDVIWKLHFGHKAICMYAVSSLFNFSSNFATIFVLQLLLVRFNEQDLWINNCCERYLNFVRTVAIIFEFLVIKITKKIPICSYWCGSSTSCFSRVWCKIIFEKTRAPLNVIEWVNIFYIHYVHRYLSLKPELEFFMYNEWSFPSLLLGTKCRLHVQCTYPSTILNQK